MVVRILSVFTLMFELKCSIHYKYIKGKETIRFTYIDFEVASQLACRGQHPVIS